ncbi:hypothetical protein N7495_001840 [Penicillium taxi]|uniref:uncharacterized protein n=1 Tax=Penicillium taxi TaxID=168475 RepID=UPI002544E496|nr:uncharacterized protein N7495_001840 [Penicillium taxi]KAJ5909158.1 hypothetical protein N7495_001840 [Penicillium taxi]
MDAAIPLTLQILPSHQRESPESNAVLPLNRIASCVHSSKATKATKASRNCRQLSAGICNRPSRSLPTVTSQGTALKL